MNCKRSFPQMAGLTLTILLLAACGTSQPASTPVPPTATPLPPTPTPVPPTVTPIPDPTDTPTPHPYPSRRHDASMAYDAESNVVILFGGVPSDLAAVNDTWAYETSTNTWTQIAQSPVEGAWGLVAYDAESDRIVYYFGVRVTSSGVGETGGTLIYDFNRDSWKDMKPEEIPFGQDTARMVYDSESDRMILFGGKTWTDVPRFFNDTWSYDLNTNTWTKMNPEVSPSERWYFAMAYLPSLDRVILFGGNSKFGRENDTWLYDYNSDSWEMVEVLEAPPARETHGVYVASLDRMILFGGDEIFGAKNDTWMFDHDANQYCPDSELMRVMRAKTVAFQDEIFAHQSA